MSLTYQARNKNEGQSNSIGGLLWDEESSGTLQNLNWLNYDVDRKGGSIFLNE